jgi:mutator protein MutT
MAPPLAVAIAVVEQHDTFLIGQRPEGKVLAHLWEFPGGKVERAETPSSAAIRECAEETGLHVQVMRLLHEQQQAYADFTVWLHFFWCRPVASQPPPRPPFVWVNRDDLVRYRFPEGNRHVLEMLARGPLTDHA